MNAEALTKISILKISANLLTIKLDQRSFTNENLELPRLENNKSLKLIAMHPAVI